MKTMIALCAVLCCTIACNRDNGEWTGNPPDVEVGDPSQADPPGEGVVRPRAPKGDPTPDSGFSTTCGNLGQPCCTDAPICQEGVCVNNTCVAEEQPDLTQGPTDDGGVTSTDDGGTPAEDSGTVADAGTPPDLSPPPPKDGGDGDEDHCLDPDKGKGDDLHPHGQHRGRIHFCSKKAVIIHIISKD